MNKSESIANLAKALFAFQSEVQAVKKESVNPFFHSNYADLASIIEAIREPLAKHELAFSQTPTGKNMLTTILMHSSGEWIEDTAEYTPSKNDVQGQGSGITYFRRYCLGAILGISTEEDDDGNQASAPKKEVKKVAPKVDKKSEIVRLMKELGNEPTTLTKEGWEQAVKKCTELELVESNYDLIIEKLKQSL